MFNFCFKTTLFFLSLSIAGFSYSLLDPNYVLQWALKNDGKLIYNQTKDTAIKGTKGIDINISKAWDITQGSPSVIVAVIDTGIDFNQTELKHALWINELEAKGQTGVDDDHNGYIDDINGYNFTNPTLPPIDKNGHGTHVSSIIAAKGNDNIGMTGVSWNVRIMPIKYLDDQMYALTDDGGTAIRYAVDNGATIINCSWGSQLPSKSLQEAVLYALEKNVLIVAGAGNEASNMDRYDNLDPSSEGFFPALYNYENVISVAAIDPKGELTTISNYGVKSIDLAAPGWGILGWTLKGLQFYQGTSQATPFVTGVAALLKSQFPDMTAAEVKKRILQNVTPLKSLRKKIKSGGFLNAEASLRNIKPDPDPLDPYFWNKKFIDIQSSHPYTKDTIVEQTIYIPNSKLISFHFLKTSLFSEDPIVFIDEVGNRTVYSGYHSDEYSPSLKGPRVKIQFKVNSQQNFWGFHIDHVSFK